MRQSIVNANRVMAAAIAGMEDVSGTALPQQVIPVTQETVEEITNAVSTSVTAAEDFRAASLDMYDVAEEANTLLDDPLPGLECLGEINRYYRRALKRAGDTLPEGGNEDLGTVVAGLEGIITNAKNKAIEYAKAFIEMLKRVYETIKRLIKERGNQLVQQKKTWKELKYKVIAMNHTPNLKRKHETVTLDVTFFSDNADGPIDHVAVMRSYASAETVISKVLSNIGIVSKEQAEWCRKQIADLDNTLQKPLDVKFASVSAQLPGFYMLDLRGTNKGAVVTLLHEVPKEFKAVRTMELLPLNGFNSIVSAAESMMNVLSHAESTVSAIHENIDKEIKTFTSALGSVMAVDKTETMEKNAERLREIMGASRTTYVNNAMELADYAIRALNRLKRFADVMMEEYY